MRPARRGAKCRGLYHYSCRTFLGQFVDSISTKAKFRFLNIAKSGAPYLSVRASKVSAVCLPPRRISPVGGANETNIWFVGGWRNQSEEEEDADVLLRQRTQKILCPFILLGETRRDKDGLMSAGNEMGVARSGCLAVILALVFSWKEKERG